MPLELKMSIEIYYVEPYAKVIRKGFVWWARVREITGYRVRGSYILCARALFTIIERCAAMGGHHGVVGRASTFASTSSNSPSRITSNKAACVLSNGPRLYFNVRGYSQGNILFDVTRTEIAGTQIREQLSLHSKYLPIDSAVERWTARPFVL